MYNLMMTMYVFLIFMFGTFPMLSLFTLARVGEIPKVHDEWNGLFTSSFIPALFASASLTLMYAIR